MARGTGGGVAYPLGVVCTSTPTSPTQENFQPFYHSNGWHQVRLSLSLQPAIYTLAAVRGSGPGNWVARAFLENSLQFERRRNDDIVQEFRFGASGARGVGGGIHFFKVVVTQDAFTNLAPGPIGPDFFSQYVDLPGASSVAVVAGTGALVNVHFSAESQCALGGSDFGWCGVRILVDGVEAQPAPADYAFDSTNNGAEGTGSWEGHAMDRHHCIRNPAGAVTTVPVQVQWRVFAGVDPTTIPQFRLDDWSLTISSALATCQ